MPPSRETITHWEREAIGDLQGVSDVQAEELPRHELRQRLVTVLHDLEDDLAIERHRFQHGHGRIISDMLENVRVYATVRGAALVPTRQAEICLRLPKCGECVEGGLSLTQSFDQSSDNAKSLGEDV